MNTLGEVDHPQREMNINHHHKGKDHHQELKVEITNQDLNIEKFLQEENNVIINNNNNMIGEDHHQEEKKKMNN